MSSQGHLQYRSSQGKDRHYFRYLKEYKELRIKLGKAFKEFDWPTMKKAIPRLKHLRTILGIKG